MSDVSKYKESPLKMLLTAPTNICSVTTSIPHINIVSNVNSLIPPIDPPEDGPTKLITYFNQYSTTGEKELDPVLMDHCYSRPWNWRPETSFIRPTKTLFVSRSVSKQSSTVPVQKYAGSRDFIDVESVPPPPIPIYDVEKARGAMEECERHANFTRNSDTSDDWEESVSRLNWTSAQSRLFSSIVKILNSDRMARLTYTGNWNEPVLRRAVIDKSARRVRTLMASIAWDSKLTQWLHQLLIDHMSAPYLAAYLDILQTLKPKLPSFVEKMMFGPNCMSRIGGTSNESLFPLLKKAWDPVATGLMQDKPKKLPGNPVFIVAPSATSASGGQSKYMHKWMKLFSSLAQVITVHANLGQTCLRMSMTNCADHLFNATRAKIQEVRNDCPGRPIILLGFNTGSPVVFQVAEVEHVVAVVSMGFPLLTAEGKRGEPDDYLLDLQYPVLFVIGQNSHRTSREDMEDLRERMSIETGLVVVGSADDFLRISKSKRRAEGITQSIVDRCILDEIAEFVGSILSSPYPPVVRPVFVTEQFNTKLMKNRVRNNSNGSSIESEPPSPQPPRTRPVGRPPGTGRKKFLQQQQLQQLQQQQQQQQTITTTTTNHQHLGTPITPRPQSGETIINPCHEPNPGPGPGLVPYLSKPEAFRVSNTAEALNRAVQSITPVSSPHPLTSSQPVNAVTSRSIITSGSTLSTLLQTGIRPNRTAATTSSGAAGNTLKILENIPVSSSLTSKVLSNGRPVTLLNTLGGVNRGANLGNVVLLPDGTKCIRGASAGTVIPGMRTITGSSSLQNRNVAQIQKQLPATTGITKLVPTRRQIITKPRVPQESTLTTPATLTTADIMDLPIIFADDNNPIIPTEHSSSAIAEEHQHQILIASKKPSTAASAATATATASATNNNNNKLVVINKQMCNSSTSSSANLLKRTAPAPRPAGQPVKFAKIIVSKRSAEDLKTHSLISPTKLKPDQPQIFSPKRGDNPPPPPSAAAAAAAASSSFEHFDLETELKATTVPKPNYSTSKKTEVKQVVGGNKKATLNIDGKLTNVTLRVPVSFGGRSATFTSASIPSRFVYTEPCSNSDNATHVVLNRTVTSRDIAKSTDLHKHTESP